MRLCSLVALALVAAVAAPVSATTYIVDVNGTGDYTAIYTAADNASEGDTIRVLPGIYTGAHNHHISGRGTNLVFLADTTRYSPVVVECGDTTAAFYFSYQEDATTLVHGFTIQNGYDQGGGGMRITNSSPTIENCVFLNNHAYSRGGAIHVSGSSSSITNCVFRGNSAADRGGAVYSEYGSSTTITGCLFDENVAPSGWMYGGAMFLEEGSETVTLCTMVGNSPDNVAVYNGIGVDISHCIVVDATEGVGVTASPADCASVRRSILFGNAAGDSLACSHAENIFHDPLFCDDDAYDYTLCDDSFALPYNNMFNELIGACGMGCEPCGTPVEAATWGAVKAMFR